MCVLYISGFVESTFALAASMFLKTMRLEAVLGLVLNQVFSSVRELRCSEVALWLEDVGLHLKDDAFVDNGTLRNLSEQDPSLAPVDLPGFERYELLYWLLKPHFCRRSSLLALLNAASLCGGDPTLNKASIPRMKLFLLDPLLIDAFSDERNKS